MPAIHEHRKEYFREYELVVRAPGLFFWTGEHSVEYGQPALMQPIDLWVYVGVRLTAGAECDIDIIHVRPSAPIHTPETLDPAQHYIAGDDAPGLRRLLECLQAELQRWQAELKIKKGISIRIYSDVPLAVGLNSSAPLSLGMALIHYYLSNNIAPKRLNALLMQLMYMEPRKLIRDDRFRAIFRKTLWCDSLVSSHYKSGAAPFASFCRPRDREHLILYFTERRGFGTRNPIIRQRLSIDEEKAMFDRLTFWGARVKTPHLLRKDTYAVSLIYCGSRDNPGAVDQDMLTWHRLDPKPIRDFLQEKMGIANNQHGLFAEPLAEILSGGQGVERSSYPRYFYSCALGMIGWRIIDALLSKEDKAGAFKELIIENNKLLKAYGVLRGPLRSFNKEFKNIVGEDRYLQLMIKMTGPGNGGLLLVIGESFDIEHINKAVRLRAQEGDYAELQRYYSSLHNNWGIPTDITPVWGLETDPTPSPPPPSGQKVKLTFLKTPEVLVQMSGKGIETVRHTLNSPRYYRVLRRLIDRARLGEKEYESITAWQVYVASLDEIDEKRRKEMLHLGPPHDKEACDRYLRKAEGTMRALGNSLGRHKIPVRLVFNKKKFAIASEDAHDLAKTGWRLAKDVKVEDNN